MFSEQSLNGLNFRNIAYRCRSTVNIDVVNIFRFHACIFQSIHHNQSGSQTFRMRSSDMMCVSRSSHASQFCIDFSTAGFCMFQFFQNQTSGSFTHDETVTACTEWT